CSSSTTPAGLPQPTASSSRKKNSEPLLGSLLREEFAARMDNCIARCPACAAIDAAAAAATAAAGGSAATAAATSQHAAFASSSLLSYITFKRFSKRAQSDPWIAEKLLRSPFVGRRFTLGTHTLVSSDEV